MSYVLHSEAKADLNQASNYYAQHAGAAIADAFLLEFQRSMKLLVANPRSGALWLSEKRRLVMRRFPYSVVYSIAAYDAIQVLAIAHQSRHPEYWTDRK